jgi:hypothetical protein
MQQLPMVAEVFSGIDRRGGDFGLKPWQITDAVNMQPIDDGHGLCLRAPQETLGIIAGDTISSSGTIMGPFQVGSDVVGLYNGNAAAPTMPAGITKLMGVRSPGIEPSPTLAWTYLGHTIVGSTLCVLMRWSGYGSIHLHVLDGKAGAPTDVNGTGSPWLALDATARTYTPRIGEAGGRVWISSPTGELWFSAIGKPRIWWTKSADDIAFTGYEFYSACTPNAASQINVPASTADLLNPDRWCGAVLELLISDGSWVAATYGSTTWNPIGAWPGWTGVTVTGAVVAGSSVMRVRILPPKAGGGVRRRANRPVQIDAFFSDPSESFIGNGTQKRFVVRDPSLFPDTKSQRFPGEDPLVFITVNGAEVTMDPTLPRETSLLVSSGYSQECVTAFTLASAPASTDVIKITRKRAFKARYSAPYYYYANGIEKTDFLFGGTATTSSAFGSTISTSVPLSGTWVLFIDKVQFVYLSSRGGGVLITEPLRPDNLYVGTYDFATDKGAESGASADPAWDEAKWQEALLLAGDGRAGTLPTAQHAAGDSGIRQIVGTRNRLLVVYANSMQLWQVDGSPSNMAKLDVAILGSGDQPGIRGVSYGGLAVTPFTNGIAAVSLSGQLNDRMAAVDMAGEIFGNDDGLLGIPVVHDVTTWPHMSAIVVAMTLAGEAYASLWLMISDRGGKSLGWWRWNVGNMVIRPGTLMAIGDRLLWHGATGTPLQSLRAGASRAGKGIVGSVTFAYQHGGLRENYKRWISLDLIARGLVWIGAIPLASRVVKSLGFHTGNSYERKPRGLMFSDTAAAFTMTLEDVDGAARIDRFSINATVLKR